jgi:predicted secreted protein
MMHIAKESKFFNLHRFINLLLIIVLTLSVNVCQAENHGKLIPEPEKEPEESKGENIKQKENALRTFTELDNTKEFRLHVGEEFQVSLQENPTTGYIWILSEASSSNIELIQREFLSSQDAVIVGSGGIRVLKFKAQKPGRANLYLELKRPWEKEGKYINTYLLNLLVE